MCGPERPAKNVRTTSGPDERPEWSPEQSALLRAVSRPDPRPRTPRTGFLIKLHS